MAIEKIMDPSHCGVERKTSEIRSKWKNPVVALAEVCEDTRSRIYDQKMIEGTEKTRGGHHRELLRLMYDYHFAIADVNATNEDIETICNKVGIKVCEYRHRHEVF